MIDRAGSTLSFGVRDWEHPAWLERFYPDDLPASWRLPYYANEFPVVLVPRQRRLAAGEAGMCVWRDEVSPGFRFYLELTSDDDRSVPTAAEAALGDHLAGYVVVDGMAHPPAGTGRPWFAARAGPGPARLWTGADAVGPCGGVGLLRLEAGAPDLRVLRGQLEHFIRCNHAGSGVLFMDAGPGAVDQAMTIAALLGVA
ncbi:hypothetical protein [Ectothiorhodospira lacustris]|uniref:hypothetical protein n=1 Tax=Ectothiorhodospira lacustris TaxID=2899127 RepID=UPI001EE85D4F|nr:hypothetical protein [Ectothiorhodospira lacustris]MCG5500670.1 hypothetical protein [Ectothiorhodospira lacustris]MCG5509944.1 hypothetical protein [Ectothiorhodospira lacustris]MCG5521198.1 hypothetical protein [Ectothiorhodospira lacustris]